MNQSGAQPFPNDADKKKQDVAASKPKKRILYVGSVDRPFLVSVILLLCLGTVMVFSASYPYANANYGDSYLFAKKQVLFAVTGVAAMLFIAWFRYFDYHYIKRFSKIILVVSFVLLAGVLVLGSDLKGAKRWYDLGFTTFQPSEVMKFALVVFFADYADNNADKIKLRGTAKGFLKSVLPMGVIVAAAAALFFAFENKIVGAVFAGALLVLALISVYFLDMKHQAPGFYYGILPFAAVLGAVGVLMYMQPHMSGLIIMAALTFAMMFLGGSYLGYLLGGAGVGAAALYFLATTMSHSQGRLDVWKNPFDNLLDGGWQPAQSLYAIGSGAFWGVGFGNSRQKHLYLPEPQNDYIFSIWCEEMGFIGAMIVIAVFLFFIYRGIYIGVRAPDRFSSLLVIGIVMHVGIQMVLNIAVVTNTLPSTGISLPFFSYGGTSLMILLAEMGVVLSVSKYSSVEKTT